MKVFCVNGGGQHILGTMVMVCMSEWELHYGPEVGQGCCMTWWGRVGWDEPKERLMIGKCFIYDCFIYLDLVPNN